ncbi:MAG: TetR/AcrR family transcriptional regulator [Saprospiraceae bacterium]|nr:TetR/AcrR family transcriptional regulator [Saprospiraceae bacterium]
MKKKDLNSGRVNQKAQTRANILDAAKVLMKEKQSISLEDVADKARLSRATIYRYYSNVDVLLTEATLDIYHKSSREIYEEVKNMAFEERIFYIQHHYNQLAQNHELAFRRYLSAVLAMSVTSNEKLRGARRVKSLNKALEDIKEDLGEDTIQKLIIAASVLMGIDALVVCKDVCDLDNEESEEVLRWALKMILKGMAS